MNVDARVVVLLSLILPAMVIAAEDIAAEDIAAEDIVVTDFEGETYGAWKVTGTAFGDGPARGTLRGQMHVSGFNGKRLVNSFLGGDQATGTLTSPTFTIERTYLRFLIGGGGFQGKTCMQLLLADKVVREATGPNTVSGGSELLEPAFWDVSDLRGQQVALRIVDDATGGWGHVNVDDIVQSDSKPSVQSLERTFTVAKDYLLIPIENGAAKIKLEVTIDGTPVRRYDTELATHPEYVDWYAYFNLSEFKGDPAKVTASRANESAFALIEEADAIPVAAHDYDEEMRPQLHFSQRVGWINDPNGMTYLDGEWHLYFQHNPVGWAWGNMTWGHAVSNDLVHWKQLPNALFPGTMAKGACFSGGAVIDKQDTAGWKQGDQDVLVAFLTDTGAGEAVAYSRDRGRSFTWYEGNPVVKHKGRDPKVIWYAYDDGASPWNEEAKKLGGHWVMVVYDEHETYGRNIAFYTSTNLKDWTEQSHVPGYYECPEFFELPLDDAKDDSRWVMFAADGEYVLGSFDGTTFTPERDKKHRLHYGKFYASQTFDNAPDGRRIQIGWMRGVEFKGMPFNQAFSIPHELTLRNTADGIRMFAAPVKEVEVLRRKQHAASGESISPERLFTLPVAGELFDVEATFEIGEASSVGLIIGGNRVAYDVASQQWIGAPAKATGGRVTVRVLLDRSQIEVWGNDGAVVISEARSTRGDVAEIQAFADGGNAKLVDLKAYELKSIWQ